jgi:hypothetical protein
MMVLKNQKSRQVEQSNQIKISLVYSSPTLIGFTVKKSKAQEGNLGIEKLK